MNPGEAPDDLAGAAESSGLDRSIGHTESRAESERAKEELRERYQELLQELRVMLPGVHVLVGFLLAVPFTSRFADVDHLGRIVFGVAMVAATGAAIVFMTPAAYHRLGDREARAARVRYSVRLMRLGLGCTAVALCAAMFVVLRFIYGVAAASLITGALGAAMAALWVILPRVHRGARR